MQFVALQQVRAWANRTGLDQTQWTHAVSFASGAFAGAAATVGSYPFDLLRTTLAAQGEPKVDGRCHQRQQYCRAATRYCQTCICAVVVQPGLEACEISAQTALYIQRRALAGLVQQCIVRHSTDWMLCRKFLQHGLSQRALAIVKASTS